jgi:hypothetical protein
LGASIANDSLKSFDHGEIRLSSPVLFDALTRRDPDVGSDLVEKGLNQRGFTNAQLSRDEDSLTRGLERPPKVFVELAELLVTADHSGPPPRRWRRLRALKGVFSSELPEIDFLGEGVDRSQRTMPMPMDRQAFPPFPSADSGHIAFQVRRDFLPRIETFTAV